MDVVELVSPEAKCSGEVARVYLCSRVCFARSQMLWRGGEGLLMHSRVCCQKPKAKSSMPNRILLHDNLILHLLIVGVEYQCIIGLSL